MKTTVSTVSIVSFMSVLFATCTAMIGHTIHGGIFWTVCNFLFAPPSWIKWLICQDVNLSIIKHTFHFLMS